MEHEASYMSYSGEILQSIQTVLQDAEQHNASDLILSAGEVPLLAVHGVLTPLMDYAPLRAMDMPGLIASIMIGDAKTNLDKLNRDEDFDFAFEGVGTVYRCNVSRKDPSDLMLVMRRVPKYPGTFQELNLPEEPLIELINNRKGLILVTGPTGSGKSTTLAAMLHYLNEHSKERKHIITLEDPIEFPYTNNHCLFTQRQIGTSTKSYASAMRSALRMIPDVVLVGEIRDAETMASCMEMADTGKLVLSTLHTNSGVETINRVTNFFDNPKQAAARLAQTLLATISVRLVPRIDRPGRWPIIEIIKNTKEVSKFIEALNLDGLKGSLATNDQVRTMDASLYEAQRLRIITPDTAVAMADNPTEVLKPRRTSR